MLAAVATGVPVYREEVLPGAIVTRLRVTFGSEPSSILPPAEKVPQLKQLITYALHRHFPASAFRESRNGIGSGCKPGSGNTDRKVMSIGFIHGVMNSDNMAISGETIDFGPCAMMM